MEKRSEPRFTAGQNVGITILGDHPRRLTARIRNASGSGLGLLLETEIRPGSALRIDLDDGLLLGEAMFCLTAEDGYLVGVQLEQILRDLIALDRCFEEFRETPADLPRKTP